MALHPPILTNSQVFFLFFYFSPCFSSLKVVCVRAQTAFSPEPPPPTSCVRRIGLSSVMLCRAFHTPTHTPTHTHLTHTCRQAGSLLYLKALIPCHSPVLCCHALCGFAPKWPRLEPWGGGGPRRPRGPRESAGWQLSLLRSPFLAFLSLPPLSLVRVVVLSLFITSRPLWII